jgi:hypothetical protein
MLCASECRWGQWSVWDNAVFSFRISCLRQACMNATAEKHCYTVTCRARSCWVPDIGLEALLCGTGCEKSCSEVSPLQPADSCVWRIPHGLHAAIVALPPVTNEDGHLSSSCPDAGQQTEAEDNVGAATASRREEADCMLQVSNPGVGRSHTTSIGSHIKSGET